MSALTKLQTATRDLNRELEGLEFSGFDEDDLALLTASVNSVALTIRYVSMMREERS
jgi:hypothetical protein